MILDAVNEVYYGGNKYTDELDRIFKEMKKVDADDIEAKNLSIQLIRTLKGFSGIDFGIYFDKDTSMYTFPINHPISISATKNGLKVSNLKKDDFILLGDNPNMVFKSKNKNDAFNSLKPREITAILLHELGHTVTKNVVPLTDYTNALNQSLQIKTHIIFALSKDKTPTTDSMIEDYVNNIAAIVRQVIDDTATVAEYGLKSIVSMIMPKALYNAYLDEKFSDGIATVYGYAPDISSAFIKLKKISIPKNNNGIMGIASGLVDMSLYGLLDEHPNSISRMNQQIDSLEYELKNTIADKKTKKEIIEQIDDVKLSIKNYNAVLKNNSYTLPEYAYGKILATIMPNSPAGDLFSKLLAKDSYIAKTLDKNLKK